MKTNLLKLAFVALFAMISGNLLAEGPQSIKVTFNGTDNANWKVSSNGTITSVENGVMNVQMADQGSNKYRADLQYQTADTYTFNKTRDVVWAIKLTGALPGSSNSRKFEINYKKEGNNTWINGINGPSGQIDCIDGGRIYYFNLGTDGLNKLGDVPAGNQIINNIHFILADAVCTSEEEAKYSVDWLASFASVDDLNAYKNLLDDAGETSAIYNDTKKIAYTNLADAVSAATSGDEIVVTETQTINSRLDINKALTLKAGAENVSIMRANGYNGIVLLSSNSDCNLVVDGIDLDGNNVNCSSTFVEAGNNGKITFKNLVIKNNANTTGTGETNQVALISKGGGQLTIENVTFSNNTCKLAAIFNGNSVVLKGNVVFLNNTCYDIYTERYVIAAKNDIQWTTPIGLYYQNPSADKVIVGGGAWDKAPVAFVMLNDGWEIYVKNGSTNGDGLIRAIEPITRATAINSYGTICLPYGATAEGAVLMEMAGRSADATGIAFDYVGGTEESATNATLEAGVPYLYRATADAQVFTYKPGSERVTVPATVNSFVGTFVDTTVAARTYFLYTADDKFHPAESAGKIGAYKCYLNTTDINTINVAGADTSARACVFGVFGSETTGIEGLNGSSSSTCAKYVQNGQIVVVKNGQKYNTAGQLLK